MISISLKTTRERHKWNLGGLLGQKRDRPHCHTKEVT